jgi:hypothetical protein
MNRVPNGRFAGEVGRVIRERAELVLRGAGGSNSPFSLSMIEATNRLASYAETRSQEDQALTSLWLLSSQRGDSDYFHPSPEQVSLIANLGYGTGAVPKPEDSLASLVRAGIEDQAEEQTKRQQEQSRAIQAAVLEAKQEIEEETAQLKAELEDTKAALTDAVAEAADLRQQLEALRLLIPGGEEKLTAKPKAKAKVPA